MRRLGTTQMQFVIKGTMAGRQGKRMPPAVVAVSVVFATGLTWACSPSLDPVDAPASISGQRSSSKTPPAGSSPSHREAGEIPVAESAKASAALAETGTASVQSDASASLSFAPPTIQPELSGAGKSDAYDPPQTEAERSSPLPMPAPVASEKKPALAPKPTATLPSPRFAMVSPVAPIASPDAPAVLAKPERSAAAASAKAPGPDPAPEQAKAVAKAPEGSQPRPSSGRTVAEPSANAAPATVPKSMEQAAVAAKATPAPVSAKAMTLTAATGDGITRAPESLQEDNAFASEADGPSIESIAAALRNPPRRDLGSSVSPEAMAWILGGPSHNLDEVVSTASAAHKPDAVQVAAAQNPVAGSTSLARVGVASTQSSDEPAIGRRIPALTRVDPQVLRESMARQASTPADHDSFASETLLAEVATSVNAPGLKPAAVPVATQAVPAVAASSETAITSAPQTALADNVAMGATARHAGVYRQTAQGIEIDLPLRVNGAQAGAITLLIAGASLEQPDVVHGEFSVRLSAILQALQPQMEPALYEHLQGSAGAAAQVTLNDLRAAGITVGFAPNGDLTLG